MSRSRKLADLLDTNGDVKVGNLDNVVLPNTGLAKSGGAMTGAITTNSTFDGRDVGTDGSKLDGIEASATADQTAAQIKTALENGIDSVHYVNASIDNEHLANDSVTVANLNLISTSSVPSLEARSDGTTDGYIQLNCTANSHGIKLKSPPHSAGASYTLTFPNNDGNANDFLQSNGSGVLTWATAPSSNATHSGEVTGATALTIADNVVDEANLKVSNSPTNGYYLSAQSGNTGGMTWAAVTAGIATQLTATSNIGLGTNAVNSITTGDYNVGLGDDALTANTEGSWNTGIGTGSLIANTTGTLNTAIGRWSLYTNVTGSSNTAIGNNALKTSTVSNNTAVGYNAMKLTTTGANNVAVGAVALLSNTTVKFFHNRLLSKTSRIDYLFYL